MLPKRQKKMTDNIASKREFLAELFIYTPPLISSPAMNRHGERNTIRSTIYVQNPLGQCEICRLCLPHLENSAYINVWYRADRAGQNG